jgi:hypothetical protein
MYREATRIWECAKALFKYDKIEETLKGEIANADLRRGIYVFVGAALLSAIIAIGISAEAMYLVAFEYNTLADMAGGGEAIVQWENLIPFGLFELLFLVPFGIVFSLVYEGVSYQLLRLSGGRGTFAQQYYLSAVVALAIAISSAIGLVAPLPCLQLVGLVALVGLTLYFLFYVSVKAYEVVHDVSFLHAFVIVVLLVVPRFLVMAVIANTVAGLFGLPELMPYQISGV